MESPRPRKPKWRAALLVAAAVALNAVFWLAVSRTAKTRQVLTITLDGPRARAAFGRYPAAVWDGAPQAPGRLGVAVTGREGFGEPGIDRAVVKAIPGEAILVRDDDGRGKPAWALPPTWRIRSHRLLASDQAVLWSREPVCGDCSIELALNSVRGLDVLLRAADDKNALLLRWQSDGVVHNLAWHVLENGQLSGAHGISHYNVSGRDLGDRYAAELTSVLRRGYLDGWRFLGWYARAVLAGLILVALLGAVWRWRGRLPWSPWPRLRSLLPDRRAIRFLLAGAVALAIVVSTRRWWSGRVLYAAAAIALLGLAASLAVLVWRELSRLRATEPQRWQRLRGGITAVAVLAICIAAAGYSAFAARVYLEGIPHVQDSVSYLMGAKAIASGHLKVPVDPKLAPFFELQLFFEHHDGYLYPIVPGLYFGGHPALLALGYLIGAPWVVNAVSSGITLGLLFLLCRELFGPLTGFLAILLGAISPFVRFQAASMMSHTSALLFVTAALLGLVYWLKRRRVLYACGMGAALGALLNVRPFDAAILGAYLGLCLLVDARSRGWRSLIRPALAAAAAFLPFALALLCQVAALGAAVNPAARELLRWLPQNIDATSQRLVELNEHLFGWPHVRSLPPELTVGILLLALLVMPKTRADWFIAGWAFLYVGAYIVTDWHANMFGPRYWLASVGGQLVLVARLLQVLPGLVSRLASALWPPGRSPRWRWLPASVGAVPMLAVAGPLFFGTIKTFAGEYRNLYSSGYNGFTAAPLNLLARHGITRGLVFIAELPNWQDLVTGIAANDISLSGHLIFARHIEGQDKVLMEAHPSHPPYVMTWNGAELVLGRLSLDPVSGEETLVPLSGQPDDHRVLGESNIHVGVPLPRGAGLVGGLAMDGRGNMHIVDSADHEVLVFDARGILRRRLTASYSFGPAAITEGQGIAVDAEGNVYVANYRPPGVVRLNPDGTFAWRARKAPDGEQQLTSPIGVALLPGGDLVVTNVDPPGLHVLRRDGTFAGYYAHGASRGDLRRPYGVAVGRNRHLYVSDSGLNALLEIDEKGQVVNRWSLPLHAVQSFQVPYVAVDSRGHAYVSDFNGYAIYHARPDKPEIEVMGSSETLVAPSGIAAVDGQLLVIKGGVNKVVKIPLP